MGWFDSISEIVGNVLGYVSGSFQRGAEEQFSWAEMTEALGGEPGEFLPPELRADYGTYLAQADVVRGLGELSPNMLIPGNLHVETERLLPTKFAYTVAVVFTDEGGQTHDHSFYVGSDVRLSQDEVLAQADEIATGCAPTGSIMYEVEGIGAAWVRRER